MEHEHGHPIGHTEVTRFRDGTTEYIGLLPEFTIDDKRARRVTLPFPTARHVYDLREKEYLGSSGRLHATLEAGQPKMYAVLPYQVEDLLVTGPNRVRRGELVRVQLKVQATSDSVGSHAARVEVTFPNGRQPEYLAQTIDLPRGQGSFPFVPALNAPAGDWKVRITEAISGKQAVVTVRVE